MIYLARLFLIAVLLLAGGLAETVRAQGVPPARLERLTRGVNAGGWFRSEYNKYGAEDLALMRRTGLRHVRLPVGVSLLFDENRPETLSAANLKRLDESLDLILAHDLAVIVEPHDVPSRLWTEDAYADRFARFWTALARRLSTRDPERVFLEAVNEPSAETAARWNQVYPKLIAAMRAGAPRHTLIAPANQRVTENDWDQVKALEAMETVADPNVVYNFHFYAPMIFTHQTASWGWDMLRHFKDIPYPSDPENVAAVAARTDPAARALVTRYGEERWGEGRIDALLGRAAAWAKARKAALTCNEFGVYRPAPPDARSRWIRDVRRTLEKNQIGWTMWEWDSGFGLTVRKEGKQVVDPQTAASLGLAAPAAVQTPKGAEKPGWKLTFHDEFDGAKLDTAKWMDRYWHGRTHSNNEQQYYAPDGYEVREGRLRLKAEKRPMGGMPYTSGMVTSFESFGQKYGWFEIRAKFPKGKGMWPAFWLLPVTKKWPPEIDVLEILGHETDKVYFSNHWRDAAGKHKFKTHNFTGPDLAAGYHTFAVEWKPGELIWYVDGVERARSTESVPDEPMYVIANLAVGGDWPGNPDAATPFPGYMDIDYIRVYQREGASPQSAELSP